MSRIEKGGHRFKVARPAARIARASTGTPSSSQPTGSQPSSSAAAVPDSSQPSSFQLAPPPSSLPGLTFTQGSSQETSSQQSTFLSTPLDGARPPSSSSAIKKPTKPVRAVVAGRDDTDVVAIPPVPVRPLNPWLDKSAPPPVIREPTKSRASGAEESFNAAGGSSNSSQNAGSSQRFRGPPVVTGLDGSDSDSDEEQEATPIVVPSNSRSKLSSTNGASLSTSKAPAASSTSKLTNTSTAAPAPASSVVAGPTSSATTTKTASVAAASSSIPSTSPNATPSTSAATPVTQKKRPVPTSRMSNSASKERHTAPSTRRRVIGSDEEDEDDAERGDDDAMDEDELDAAEALTGMRGKLGKAKAAAAPVVRTSLPRTSSAAAKGKTRASYAKMVRLDDEENEDEEDEEDKDEEITFSIPNKGARSKKVAAAAAIKKKRTARTSTSASSSLEPEEEGEEEEDEEEEEEEDEEGEEDEEEEEEDEEEEEEEEEEDEEDNQKSEVNANSKKIFKPKTRLTPLSTSTSTHTNTSKRKNAVPRDKDGNALSRATRQEMAEKKAEAAARRVLYANWRKAIANPEPLLDEEGKQRLNDEGTPMFKDPPPKPRRKNARPSPEPDLDGEGVQKVNEKGELMFKPIIKPKRIRIRKRSPPVQDCDEHGVPKVNSDGEPIYLPQLPKKRGRPRKIRLEETIENADAHNATVGDGPDASSMTMRALAGDVDFGRISSRFCEVEKQAHKIKEDRRLARLRMRERASKILRGEHSDLLASTEDGSLGASAGPAAGTKAAMDKLAHMRKEKAKEVRLAKRREEATANGRDPDELSEEVSDDDDISKFASHTNAVGIKLVHGEFIVDESTLTIDQHAQHQARGVHEYEAIEESENTRFVNSNTYLSERKQRGEKWTKLETEHFFKLIGQFGTDFEMIARLFPGRTRKMIKNKWNREEKLDSQRCTDALMRRIPIDLEVYSKITNTDLSGPPPEITQLKLPVEAAAGAAHGASSVGPFSAGPSPARKRKRPNLRDGEEIVGYVGADGEEIEGLPEHEAQRGQRSRSRSFGGDFGMAGSLVVRKEGETAA